MTGYASGRCIVNTKKTPVKEEKIHQDFMFFSGLILIRPEDDWNIYADDADKKVKTGKRTEGNHKSG